NDNKRKKWFKDLKLDENISFNEYIDKCIKKYKLEKYDKISAINIIKVRYEIRIYGYSLFKPVTIAKDISIKSLSTIEENKHMLRWC
ncbi:MAG: hypothetical protein RSF67_09035, partial [Clostridia bacterium]